VVATDISARCLRFAEFNAGLNAPGSTARSPVGRWTCAGATCFAPVAGETFDLIVSNPPFVITPRHADIPQYSYRDGLRTGDEIVAQFVREVAAFLTPGGFAQLLEIGRSDRARIGGTGSAAGWPSPGWTAG